MAAETAKQQLKAQVEELQDSQEPGESALRQDLAKVGRQALDFKAKAEGLAAELLVAHTKQSGLQGELQAVQRHSEKLQAALDEALQRSAQLGVAEHKAAAAEQQAAELKVELQKTEKKASEGVALHKGSMVVR